MDKFVLYNYSTMVNEKQFRFVAPPQALYVECIEALGAILEECTREKEESDKKLAEQKEAESLEINS